MNTDKIDGLIEFMSLVREGEVPTQDGRIMKVKLLKSDPAIDSPEFEKLTKLRQFVLDWQGEN